MGYIEHDPRSATEHLKAAWNERAGDPLMDRLGINAPPFLRSQRARRALFRTFPPRGSTLLYNPPAAIVPAQFPEDLRGSHRSGYIARLNGADHPGLQHAVIVPRRFNPQRHPVPIDRCYVRPDVLGDIYERSADGPAPH